MPVVNVGGRQYIYDRKHDIYVRNLDTPPCENCKAVLTVRPEVEDSDTARLNWLEDQMQSHGDGHTEPRQESLFFGWSQSPEQPYFPGLRKAIDEQRVLGKYGGNVGDLDDVFVRSAGDVDAGGMACSERSHDAASDEVRRLVGKLDQWRMCLSYSDSFVGEPAGLFKETIRALAKAVDPIYPEKKEINPFPGVVIYTADHPEGFRFSGNAGAGPRDTNCTSEQAKAEGDADPTLSTGWILRETDKWLADKATAPKPAGCEVTEDAVERLARFIYHKESLNCKTVDQMYFHQSNWRRAIPEAREMLLAALAPGGEGSKG